MTLNVLRPIAKSLGIKGNKIERFTERELAFLVLRRLADEF